MSVLAIDPGTDMGFALFDARGCLTACGLGDPRSSEHHRIRDITRVVIEKPMIYPGGRTKDPNAVVTLAVKAGEWGGLYRQWVTVEYVLPWQWKGQVPKDIHHERVLAKLTDEEHAIVNAMRTDVRGNARAAAVAPSKRHNVIDAVGLGLFAVGR